MSGSVAYPAVLSMNRPTPNPSQEGNRHRSASCPFPSWEGLGVGSWSQCMRGNERRPSRNRNRLSLCHSEDDEIGSGQTMWQLCKEFLSFLKQEKKWWLVPMVLILLLLAVLIAFS